MDATVKSIMASFIAQSIKEGVSLEDAIELGFQQVQEFITGLANSQTFKDIVFEKAKERLAAAKCDV